jgi:hypothetical protein
MQSSIRRFLAVSAGVALAIGTLAGPAAADGRTLFITSAVEGPNNTVTFPLHRGTSHSHTVYYVITDTSDGSLADRLGVNEPSKLANARNTGAVQHVTFNPDGSIDFPASVDFTPVRSVTPSATGFPPLAAAPGAVGETGYSPLIQLPNGTVVNAPQIANASGQADKVITLDVTNMRVTYKETMGFSGDNPVKYTSFDASDPGAAALEDVTYAPALNAAPTVGDDSGDSARASLAAFTNGQTRASNPQRQGLNSAILDGKDPLNVLRWNPSQGRYSPLWDVHFAEWQVPTAQRLRQTDWGTIQGLVDHGQIAGLGGSRFKANGFIVNCPIVSMN